ncbi:MAG: AIPR family protein [Thermodesulfobacteriota bacterium]|nr:AIPR family protein [Thermodesulfobacteriota bacterium]
MDRITKSLLDEFVNDNSLGTLPEETAFEHFCGFLVTASHFSESFSSEDISVGAGGDCGIDCITVIVNGCLVTDPEEIEDLEQTNGYLDVTLVFVQAERSSSFETAKIGQFGFGVADFLSESPSLPQNDDVQLAYRIVNEIFDRSARFTKGNPQCFLYYTTTGRWSDDQNLTARRDAVARDVEDLGLFRKVRFVCLGAEELQGLYRHSKNAICTEITFTDRTVLPDLPGVEQAYIGVLPAREFMKLIENENQEVLTTLFYDNVRHWQEWNPVNKEMKETLDDPERRIYFPLMNNGVTIVAKRVAPTANKFVVEDYTVVNGCQTSYVLHEKGNELDDVAVPIRLIATEDVDIRNAIIKATNRQTQVTEDQLFALSDFPKNLEAFFPTFVGRKKLYYERRSRQYNAVDGIEKVRVLDMRALVRAFASMFLEMPHRTTKNYKALLKTVGTDIFNPSHRLEPYYVAGYAHYRLEFLFRNQQMAAELKAARYHLLFASRLLYSTDPLPTMNSHEMRRYGEGLMEVLWDDARAKALFEEAEACVRAVAAGNLHRDNIRTEPFTAALRKHIQQ